MSFNVNEKYIKIPSVTTTERNALTAANGMLVYDTDLAAFYKYENGSWSAFAGGSASWGGITGTLSNQTDLQNALNAKQNTLTNPVTGTGTNNEIAAFNSTGSTITSLATTTYPTLTELSYVKGLTSAVQTQINNRALVLLSTATASNSSSIDFEVDYTVYKKYVVEFTDVQSSVNYTDDLWLRVGTGSPVAYQSGANDYSWIRNNLSTSTAAATANTASGAYSDTKVILDPFMNNTGVYSVSGSVVIYNPSNSTYHKNIEWTSTMRWITAALIIGTSKYSGSATYRAATAITGLRIMSSTGNILTGTFKIYGVA